MSEASFPHSRRRPLVLITVIVLLHYLVLGWFSAQLDLPRLGERGAAGDGAEQCQRRSMERTMEAMTELTAEPMIGHVFLVYHPAVSVVAFATSSQQKN